jgi:hypothetical protein
MVRTGSFLAALAVLPGNDNAPRVIQQFSSIFLVSRTGDLWGVHDCATPGGPQTTPSSRSTLPVRTFVPLGRRNETRARLFAPYESREIDPESLQAQLDEADIA